VTTRLAKVHKPSTWFLAGVGFLALAVASVLQSVVTHRPAAWGGLLPICVLGYSVYCFIQWWKAVGHPILSREAKRMFSIGWTVFGGVLIAISFSLKGPDGVLTPVGAGFAIAGLAAVIGYWAIAFGVAWSRAISAEMKVASTPVPSPAEIADLLEDEWGRAPTIVEVAAVHQMLTSRRNEALVATGLSLGALFLVDQHLHQPHPGE
jgi:hypothetical protein